MTNDQALDAGTYAVGGPGVAWRETGGEIVVLDVERSVYYGLNASAAELWKRLATGADRAELTATLMTDARVTDPPVTEQRAGSDVDEFLAELRRYGLLQRR